MDLSLLNQALKALTCPTIATDDILSGLFPLQRDLILDPSKRKSFLKGRRAGATHAIVRYLIYSALEAPGTTQLYLGITRDQAKINTWDLLKGVNEKLKLNCRVNESELRFYFPNGSIIWISGANKARDTERFRGPAYRLVVLDECASFGKSVDYLIKEVLSAALKDYDGTLLLAGTPGRLLQGLFFEATEGEKKEKYKQFFWTVTENPKFPLWSGLSNWEELARESLQAWADEDHAGVEDPAFQREYKGVWVRDGSSLLFSGFTKDNIVTELPKFEYNIMGVDLGFNDAFAIADISWTSDEPNAYIHNCYAKSGLDFTAMAQIIKKRTQERFYKHIAIDSAAGGKTLSEELGKRHHIFCEPAQKTEKAAHIQLIDTDFRRGYLKVKAGEKVIQELKGVQWNEDYTREAEEQVCDLVDCLCYAYRAAHPYFYREKPKLTEQQKMYEARLKRVQEEQAQKDYNRRRRS